MLVELRIRDYAVVQDLTLTLGPGLNALSGETGAGKSIIVGALSLLLGERASSDVVRTGAERASVEAVFDVTGLPGLQTRLHELGYPPDIIEKQLAHSERNKVRAAYNHASYLPQRREMMQFWADYLDNLKAGADIVAIGSKTKQSA